MSIDSLYLELTEEEIGGYYRVITLISVNIVPSLGSEGCELAIFTNISVITL